MTHEKALTVVIGVDEPAGDVISFVAMNLFDDGVVLLTFCCAVFYNL